MSNLIFLVSYDTEGYLPNLIEDFVLLDTAHPLTLEMNRYYAKSLNNGLADSICKEYQDYFNHEVTNIEKKIRYIQELVAQRILRQK